MPSSLPKDLFSWYLFHCSPKKKSLTYTHTHASSGAVWWSKAKENRWNLKFKSPARSFSSWPSLTERREERESQTSGAQVYPSDSFSEKILEERKGEIFSHLVVVNNTQTHSVRLLWDGWEGSFPFFLFFARAFWRAAAGVKAGPAATTTLLLAIQGLCSSAFFCFPAADTDPSTRLTRVSQWIPNAKIFIKTQENTQLGSVRTWVERFLILLKCPWRHPLSPFPEWLFSILFRFFFWNFVFPAQLMTT